jgi:hypothetical protein
MPEFSFVFSILGSILDAGCGLAALTSSVVRNETPPPPTPNATYFWQKLSVVTRQVVVQSAGNGKQSRVQVLMGLQVSHAGHCASAVQSMREEGVAEPQQRSPPVPPLPSPTAAPTQKPACRALVERAPCFDAVEASVPCEAARRRGRK